MERSCKNCNCCKQKEGKDEPIYFCSMCGMVATEELLPKSCDIWRQKDDKNNQ